MNDEHETMFNADKAYPIWSMKQHAEDLIEQDRAAKQFKETEDAGEPPF